MSTSSSAQPVRLLSVTDAADALGLSVDVIRRLIRRSELGCVRVGRRVLVHPDDLTQFIEDHRLVAS
jgi:excisionase family DNA binding protein